MGCNELGFTPSNVQAICRIGGSTKKVEAARKGYIGEKGIGFKSIFKVADKVWVSSGALQFQFDEKACLGMIAPRWCDFESHPLVDERTMFCFHIEEAGNCNVVENELLKLQPELLLFLRQLRFIDIKIQDPTGNLKESFRIDRNDSQYSGMPVKLLSRHSILPTSDQVTEPYVVCQRTVREMPFETRREGVMESEVIIAFPIGEDWKPNPRDCSAFNFLPIRSYGLPVSDLCDESKQQHFANDSIVRFAG